MVHFLLAVLGVAGLQIAINLFNDVEDYRRLIDLPNTAGGSGAIQGRWFTPMELRKAAWTSLLLGSAAGTAVVFSHPQILAPIAGIAGLGTLLYSGRSWGLKYRALGDVAVFLLCGPLLTLGFSGALANGVGASALWLGGFFGWLACSLLHVNNLQDIEVDRARGLSTLAILLGFERSKVWLALIQFFAMACLIAGWATGVLPVGVLGVAVVQAALSLRWLKRIWPASGPESALLARVRIDAAQIHLSSGLVLVVVLALSRLVQF